MTDRMKNTLLDKLHYILPLLFRVLLGSLFLWSGFGKFFHLDIFLGKVTDYHILPDFLANAYAALLPWLEILAGLYLLLGLFTRFTILLTSGLLLSFLVAIIIVLFRGDQVDCGCFIGGNPQQVSYVDWGTLVRDLLMLAAAAYLYWQHNSPFSLDRWLRR